MNYQPKKIYFIEYDDQINVIFNDVVLFFIDKKRIVINFYGDVKLAYAIDVKVKEKFESIELAKEHLKNQFIKFWFSITDVVLD